MSRPTLLFTFLGILPLAACAGEPRARPVAGEMPASPPPSREEGARSRYSDKTILYYDPSHGNQIEYMSPEGRAFLWYPDNRSPVPGRWRLDADRLCFQYGEHDYNPVTGDYGGEWECTPLEWHESSIVDAVSGDVFGLAKGGFPFRLPAQPRYNSIADVKPAAPPPGE